MDVNAISNHGGYLFPRNTCCDLPPGYPLVLLGQSPVGLSCEIIGSALRDTIFGIDQAV